MELKITVNEVSIREAAQKLAEDRAHSAASAVVREYFTNKRDYGSKDGVGTIIVREKVDQYLLSKDLDTLIAKIVERELVQSVETLAKEVVRQRLGKIIFSDSATKIDLANVREILQGTLDSQGEANG